MRGIDLYKAILDGNEKYHNKKFTSAIGEVHVEGKNIFNINGDNILCSGYLKIKNFIESEITEIATPIPWQECIQKWSENHQKYKIKVTWDNYTIYYGETYDDILEDDDNCGISVQDILKGKWYLIER